ncbi:MAG: hypothetical protein NZM44_04250, partial [Candidatus Calescibacterium sp.]|nr:hypothetical protein [Candidatus Calescibacterium sp.]
NVRFIPIRRQPEIQNVELLDQSSNLKCGVYQFAFRYLTHEGNALNVGLISNTIHVGGSENYVGRNIPVNSVSYDGDTPETFSNKVIKFDIKNLDTNFRKVQVIVILYEGFSNVFKSYVYRTLTIPPSGEINSFYYDGYNNEKELLLEDVTELGISYTTAKCVEQKDNRLFISNLKDNKERYKISKIADKIKVKYKVEVIPGGNDANYQNVSTSFNKRGYQRGEVYSFAFAVQYKDGSRSFAYHIPAGYGNPHYIPNSNNFPEAVSDTPGVYIGNTEGYLGVFESSVSYTSSSLVGTYNEGDRIRHHKMPTLKNEPHFQNVGGTESIRALKVEFDYQQALLDFIAEPENQNFLNEVDCFLFLRQRRSGIDSNASILQQGIVVEIIETEFDFDFEDNPTNPSPPNLVYKKLPFAGGFEFKTRRNQFYDLITGHFADVLFGAFDEPLSNGYTPPPLSGGNGTERVIHLRNFITPDNVSLLCFYSPESVLDNVEGIPDGALLRKELVLNCNASDVQVDYKKFRIDVVGSTIQKLEKSSRLWALFPYNSYDNLNPNIGQYVSILRSMYVDKHSDVP